MRGRRTLIAFGASVQVRDANMIAPSFYSKPAPVMSLVVKVTVRRTGVSRSALWSRTKRPHRRTRLSRRSCYARARPRCTPRLRHHPARAPAKSSRTSRTKHLDDDTVSHGRTCAGGVPRCPTPSDTVAAAPHPFTHSCHLREQSPKHTNSFFSASMSRTSGSRWNAYLRNGLEIFGAATTVELVATCPRRW